jgi:hypothetical protein
MKLSDFLDMDMGDVIDWLVSNHDDYLLVPKESNKTVNEKLIIALKAQHQPHMDYIPELDCTVAELLKELDHD